MPTKQYKIQYKMQNKLKETQEKKSLSKLPPPKYKVGDLVISMYTFGYIKVPPIWNSTKKTYVYSVYVETVHNNIILTRSFPMEEDELKVASYKFATGGLLI